MAKMSNKRNWRETYINILLNGPTSEIEYKMAAELIDEGFAKGSVIKNNTGKGNPIAALKWRGPTTSGREYLEQLQTKVQRQSLAYRARSGVVIVGAWLFGFLSNYLAGVLTK